MSDQATHLRELLATKAPATSSTMTGAIAVQSAISIAPAQRAAPVHRHRHLSVSASRDNSAAIATRAFVESRKPPIEKTAPRLARAIAICSGKGGVGKSNIAVNLAVAMSQPMAAGGLGLKVCLLDADLGLANVDLLCNLSPRITLEHVVKGQNRLADAMILAPGGFRLVPGASGVSAMADLAAPLRIQLMEQLAALERVVDVILIDCGAGISSSVLGFASAAHTTLITTVPEPTAITDSYGMIKSLVNIDRAGARRTTQVLVNMCDSEDEARAVFHRIQRVSHTFLQHPLTFAGGVPLDPAVQEAVRQRIPFSLHAPDSNVTHAIRRIARSLMNRENEPSHQTAVAPQANARTNGHHDIRADNEPSRTISSFFGRLAVRLGIAEYVE